MPFNLLLPPLLGGYFFITRFNGSAYKCSSYSGYRLIISASIAALFLLIACRILIWLLAVSASPVIFHQIVFPAGSVGLLLLLFGAYKTNKAASRPAERIDTDSDDDFAARKQRLRRRLNASWGWLAAGILALIFLAIHAMWGQSQISISLFIGSLMIASVFVTISVNKIKSLSRLHGYQVAFRLGMIISVGVALFVFCHIFHMQIVSEWKRLIPINYAGISFMTFALGLTLWWPANLLYPYRSALERLIDKHQVDGLESFFYTSQKLFKLVCITLSDDKVYVGFVDREIAIPGRTDDFVRIVMTASGYRDPITKKVTFTTKYTKPYHDAIKRGADLSADDLAKTIPLGQIRSAGLFDAKFFSEFQK